MCLSVGFLGSIPDAMVEKHDQGGLRPIDDARSRYGSSIAGLAGVSGGRL